MGFEHFHVGKAGAPFRHAKNGASGNTSKARRAADSTTSDPSCATGSFYSSPALASSVDSLTPLNIVWRPELACFLPAPSLVDVFLYAPGDDKTVLYHWDGVPYSAGNYTVSLMPRWWNSAPSKQVQLMIVPSQTPVFLSTIPAGPVFNATYTPPTSGSVPVAADTSLSSGDSDHTTVTPTGISGVSSHSMSAGKKAAAVLLPLLFVLLLGLAYLKISRARGQAKRSAWSEKLDKRMSTISADWKAITPGGAKEAVRQSIANRNSSFSFGAIRPGAVEGEPVVMGEKQSGVSTARGGSIEISEKDLPRTSLGSGVGVGVGARRPRTHAAPPDRGSRAVSFADSAHPRPSLSSRYSRGSRAFHTASYAAEDDADLPPVPALPSPSRAGAFGAIERISSGGAERNSTFTGAGNAGNAVYQNGAAWSSGERVEGVDGGYGARSVSPTGRVHTVNYPASMLNTSDTGFAYGTPSEGSYFSPVTPTPGNTFTGMGVYEPSADSAYAPTTFGAFPSPNPSDVSSGGIQSGLTSPRQIGGPLTLTPEDIRRRMTPQNGGNGGQEGWRQSVDEVFGALSMMRTGNSPSSPDATEDDDGGDYLFAPPQEQEGETVFQYPGTPAPGSAFGSPAIPAASPFAMPMQPPTMSPDDMLRAYAAKHASTISASPSPLSAVRTAEVVPSLKDTGMRVLYKQPDGAGGNEGRAQSPALIRAGPGARLSR